MFKRILPFLIILVIAIPVVLLVLFAKDKQITVYQTNAIEMVPEEPLLILESRATQDLIKTIIQSTPLYPAFESIQGFKQYTGSLKLLDSILSSNQELAASFAKAPAIMSLHASGKDQYQAVFIIETKGHVRNKALEDLFSKIGKGPGNWKELAYDRESMYQVNFETGVKIPQLNIYQSKKYLVISPSQLLVESIIRIEKTGNQIVNDQDLNRLIKTAGIQNKASLYIQTKRIPAWWAELSNPELKKKMSGYNRYGGWLEMDVTVRNDAVLLSGLGLSGDGDPSFLDVFSRQEPQPVDVENIVPGSAGAFIHFGIQKPVYFLEDLGKYMDAVDAGRERSNVIADAQKLTGEDMVKVYGGLLAQDLILIYMATNDGSVEKPVVIAGTQSRNQTFLKMEEWLSSKADKENRDIASYRTTYKIDQEKVYSIYQNPIVRLPYILGGSLFDQVKGKYFSFIGNYLLLGDDLKVLQDVIYHFELNKLLTSDILYQSSINLMNTRSSFTLFAIPSRIPGLMTKILKKEYTGFIAANDTFLQDIGSLGLQFHQNNGYYHNFFIKCTDQEIDRPQTVWESRLDAKVACKPVFTINHVTQAREILVQDDANNLYLINTSGRVLWKLPLSERINSEVFQIDIYKNNKLQFLFSTGNYLHLIDRNGNYVEKYPVKLRAEATNGMALFDYDQNKNYRVLIACNDKRTYMYDAMGSVVKGWDFQETEGTVTQAAQHIRAGSKDYLVFADEMRIYILDRKGDVRVQPEKQFPVSRNNQMIYDPNSGINGPRLLITDAEGNICSVYMDGKVTSQTIRKFEYNHFFQSTDLNRDGKFDYIFIEGDKLEVYRHDGQPIFNHKFDEPVEYNSNIYQFSSSQKKIGVVEGSKNNIYLFNDDGSMYKGFPLKGCTPFTIGFLETSASHFNLIVGSEDMFLYNYRVK